MAEGRDEFDNVCSEVVEGVFRGPHRVVRVTIPSVEREKLIIKGVVYNILIFFYKLHGWNSTIYAYAISTIKTLFSLLHYLISTAITW